MHAFVLLTLSLLGLFPGCSAVTFRSQEKTQAVVIDVGEFSESYDAPLQALAKAVQTHPNSRLFRVTGTLMFGGWQNYTFWYDRQSQRLRYSYASGGETYAGEKESVWAGVTTADLGDLARQTENVSSESFFKTLPQLGCRQVYFHDHQPDSLMPNRALQPVPAPSLRPRRHLSHRPLRVSAHSHRLPRYAIVDLGEGRATDISDEGQIVGTYNAADESDTAPDSEQSWVWRRGVRRSVGPGLAARMPGRDPAWGSAYKGLYAMAYVKAGGTMRFLTVPLGTWKSGVQAVGGAGWAVGFCVFGDGRHAALWDLHKPGVQPRVLQPPGTSTGWAADINDAGEVVGSAKVINSPRVIGFLWRSGHFTNQGSLFPGRAAQTYPTRINRRGQVIGYESAVGVRKINGDDPLEYPFLWEKGRLYDLGRLLVNNCGWVLTDVSSLNNKGQIVGWGYHHGNPRAILLNPRV